MMRGRKTSTVIWKEENKEGKEKIREREGRKGRRNGMG